MSADSRRYQLLGRFAAAQDLAACEPILVDFACLEFAPQSVIVLLYRDGRIPISLMRWIPDELLRRTFDEDYFELGGFLDPFALYAAKEPEMSAYRIFEIAPDRFENSEYFANYYKKTGMVDELGALIRIDDSSVVHLSLGRNAGFPKFTSRETRKFKTICPALMPKLAGLAIADKESREAADATTSPGQSLPGIFRDLVGDGIRRLSPREAEIAALITQGYSSRSISMNLEISIQTVKVHRRNIYKKLSISAQSELFGLALSAHSGNARKPDPSKSQASDRRWG